MRWEDAFDFLAPDDIRIKGHRIGIETVLDDYLRGGRSAEEIARSYPSLSVDEIRATIRYYHANREAVEQYLADWRAFGRQAREQQRRHPPAVLVRLRGLMVEANPAGETS